MNRPGRGHCAGGTPWMKSRFSRESVSNLRVRKRAFDRASNTLLFPWVVTGGRWPTTNDSSPPVSDSLRGPAARYSPPLVDQTTDRPPIALQRESVKWTPPPPVQVHAVELAVHVAYPYE